MSFLPSKTLIIAEIGSNHDGDLDKAFRMIDIAAESGADVAKFQGFLADEMYDKSDSNYHLLKKLEVPLDWYPKLIERCNQQGVKFLSTATNFTTLQLMEELNVEWYKVASGNISHYPIIDKLIEINKPIIFSTGLSKLEEIIDLSSYLDYNECRDYSFLHCVSKYPVAPDQMNLLNISSLRHILNCPIGFSDHSMSEYFAIAAVALGAKIIEKHITIDRNGISPDHSFSMLSKDFKNMVDNIRLVERGMNVDFKPNLSSMKKFRRSLHYSRSIEFGHIIQPSDIMVIRPDDGLPPVTYKDIIGKKIIRNVDANSPVALTDFEEQ